MKKIVSIILLTSLVACSILGCGKKIPENVKEVQHKIDKALESEASYENVKEIQDLYNELLKEEQEMITDYEKIEEMYVIDENVAGSIFAAKTLKSLLKNPNSLELLSASCGKAEGKMVIKLEYVATNGFGGASDDDFYCLIEMPKEENGVWNCELEEAYSLVLDVDMYSILLGTDYNSRKANEYGQVMYN